MVQCADKVGEFSKNQDGGMTVLGLYVSVAMFILGGLAVDVSSLIAARTQLQVAADLAAHAALYSREKNSAADARADALALVQASFPNAAFGDLLTTGNIQFGTYNSASQTFTVDNTSSEAVYVQTERLTANNNPVASFLMQFAGYSEWDVITPSVFEVYRPRCLRDGWVAESTVDSQSNNEFQEGFCIHSNTVVEINNSSIFEVGVTVSMPDQNDLVMPPAGWESNDGIEEALADAYINLRILGQLDQILAGLFDEDSEHFRPYITDGTAVYLETGQLETSDFIPGRIHTFSCSGNERITIDANAATLQGVVLVTDCKVQFSNASALEDVVIFTTNTDDRSVMAPQGLRLGAIDECDPAGSVQVVTYGGFEVAAGLEIYSSQVIAKGPIQFAAAADGVYGGSFISGETIDATSNTLMGHCPNSNGEVFEVDLFRMVG